MKGTFFSADFVKDENDNLRLLEINIDKDCPILGIKLNDDELSVVTSKVIELGDKKEKVTIEDLPYIISDVLEYPTKKKDIIIESYVLTHAKTLRPSASLFH